MTTAVRDTPLSEVEDALLGRRILLDCRWLGMGGAGRLTEFLLDDLSRTPPPGEWTLWGREEKVHPLAFDGAQVAPTRRDPRSLLGQRDLLGVPSSDIAVYMHQIRPLRPGRSITFILDTIPIRHGGRPLVRAAKRLFFRSVAAMSTRVVTISEFSKECIVRDLGLTPEEVGVVHFPVDQRRAQAIAGLRSELPHDEVVLYVGRFDGHKNLRRLVRAFADTAFAASGGRLVLLGGWEGEAEELRAWVERSGIERVEVRPACSEDELRRSMATSRALVAPSLEEGYGLPAFEAAASGIPVAASATGAMRDLPPDVAVLFEPHDERAMTDAIDGAVSRGSVHRYQVGPSRFGAFLVSTLASVAATS